MDEFDTAPMFEGEGNANGGWGVYPFLPSGNILFTDHQTGLYLFSVSGVTSVNPKLSANLIDEYVLYENYPNPFNPITTIEYFLPVAGNVSLVIYNVLGEQVDVLIEGQQPKGNHKVACDAANFVSGIYFYRLQTADFVQTKKMVLLR